MGIVSFGSYVPRYRLSRRSIGEVLGASAGQGTRAVAGYDEDTTSLGVAAALKAVDGTNVEVETIVFATSRPSYLEKTNATAIHAALDLPRHVDAADTMGGPRSAHAAFDLAAARRGLAVIADIRFGRPGSADESEGGDAAAAFMFGDDDQSVALQIGYGSTAAEFMDRWRVADERHVRVWEERFGEQLYVPLAEQALQRALASCGSAPADIDIAIVTGTHTRAVSSVRRRLGFRSDAHVDDLTSVIGQTGAAHPWLLLAGALSTAEPGQTIALVSLCDGCVVRVFRTTDRITEVAGRSSHPDDPTLPVAYADLLTWRSMLEREPPRRPRPAASAAPPTSRSVAWKFGFVGSVDEAGNVHVPPSRVSLQTGSVDQMTPIRLATVPGNIVSFTIDHLAFSMSPPTIVAIVDFVGGGRYQCELTDADPAHVAVGQAVEMTFRKLFTEDGIHNYFWKARPVAVSTKETT